MNLRYANTSENRAASQQQIKSANLNLILNLINQNQPLSRARLAEMTGLSPTTVSSLTEELIDNRLIEEIGLEDTGNVGRKAMQLQILPDGGYSVGVEMVETGIYTELFDLRCNSKGCVFTELNSFDNIGSEIVASIYRLLNTVEGQTGRLTGVSIAIPGLIDPASRRILASTVLNIKMDNDFADVIQESFANTPVFLCNYSSLCAYAEMTISEGGSIRDMLLVDINTGIGCGIILDGKIFNGQQGYAGELGHVTIDHNGPKCKCGSRGCLEVMASIPALLQRAAFAVMTRQGSMLNRLCGNVPSMLALGMICQALEAGDALTVEIVSETARCLAFGLNNAINMLNPQALILSGQITKLGPVFLDLLQKFISEIEMRPMVNKMILRYSNLGSNQAIVGGAKFALDQAFSSGRLTSGMMV